MHRPFPTGAPAHKRLSLRGSGWIDRADANRSGGGVQNSSHLHALVKEILRLLLVVELIGGLAVSGRKDKFVPGFCDRSVKRRLLRRRANRILIVRLHWLLLSCGIGRRTGRTLRERRVTSETQSNSQRHHWQHHGQNELCFHHSSLLGEDLLLRK